MSVEISHLSQLSKFDKTQILWKLSTLSNILIFIDLLPVPWSTSEKREKNSKKIIWSYDNFV